MAARFGRGAAIGVLAAYFAIAPLPNWWPAAGAGPFFFYYLLSLPLVLLALVMTGAAGLVLRFRGRALQWSRHLLVVSAGGLALFAVAAIAAVVLRRSLPAGSFVRPFDPAVWQRPDASGYAEGDITPRQKMLGHAVRMLPGKRREEIERLLGPSLDTSYFRHSGRDLIYITGPQRDSLFAIDSEWLLIWLDESGRFERYEIATD